MIYNLSRTRLYPFIQNDASLLFSPHYHIISPHYLKIWDLCSRKLSRDKNGIIFVSISSIRYVSEECQMLSDHGCLFDMGALWWVPLGKVPFGGFLWERSFLEKSFMEG